MTNHRPEASVARTRKGALLIVLIVLIGIVVYATVDPQFSGSTSTSSNAHTSTLWLCGRNSVVDNTTEGTSTAAYDDQTFFDFNRNFTSLSYNVTAVEQNDSFGFGPGYMLNGATSKHYWYQVGLTWNWGTVHSSNHLDGFNFFYQVYNPNGTSIFPASGGGGMLDFNGPVNIGDVVMLKLNFTNGHVGMYAVDWNTNSSQYVQYGNMNATVFIPHYSTPDAYYTTGLLEEWYHVNPYQCSRQQVIFSSSTMHQQNITVCVDEWNNTGLPDNQWFTNQSKFAFPTKCVPFLRESPTGLSNYSYAVVNVSTNDHEYIVY